MELILGGAYQGKRDFARTAYGVEHFFTCNESSLDIDYSAPAIDRLEEFCLACVRAGKDPVKLFEMHREAWQSSVLICRDIFCGVVPLGAETREWRQVTGQFCRYLSKNAQHVTRVFCGLPQTLK